MSKLIELLNLLPKSVQIAIAGLIIGGAAFAGHEVRYMTVADFTKSYILDLKREIRSLKKDIEETNSEEVRSMLREELEQLLDELCYELPEDWMCRNRE